MTSDYRADRPNVVPESEWPQFAALLPKGAFILFAVEALPDPAHGGGVDDPSQCQSGPCDHVHYGVDADHSHHHAVICGSGTSFEVCSDVVTGHW
jgi:hypothetical protein